MSYYADRSLLSSSVFVLLLAITWICLILTGNDPIRKVTVQGESMEATLHDKESGIIFTFGKIKQYDIIVFQETIDGESTLLIKRVIGMPGDSVECKSRVVYVNGNPIIEFAKDENSNFDFNSVLVPQDSYFVLGDNREVSLDSRYKEIGFVKKTSIVGIFQSLE